MYIIPTVREEVTHPGRLADSKSMGTLRIFFFLNQVKEFIPLMFSAVFFLPLISK